MTSARPLAWLLLVAVALSAMPWEASAASRGFAGDRVALDRPPVADGGEGAAEGGCCVCLCFYSSSPLLPANAPAVPRAALAPGLAVVSAGLDRAPAQQSRLVFHPPRRA